MPAGRRTSAVFKLSKLIVFCWDNLGGNQFRHLSLNGYPSGLSFEPCKDSSAGPIEWEQNKLRRDLFAGERRSPAVDFLPEQRRGARDRYARAWQHEPRLVSGPESRDKSLDVSPGPR